MSRVIHEDKENFLEASHSYFNIQDKLDSWKKCMI